MSIRLKQLPHYTISSFYFCEPLTLALKQQEPTQAKIYLSSMGDPCYARILLHKPTLISIVAEMSILKLIV